MKNKKTVIIVLIILIVGGLSVLLFKHTEASNQYENVIERIDKKDTFMLIITKDSDKDYYMQNVFEYYSNTYSIPVVHLTENKDNEFYNKLMEKLPFNNNVESDAMFCVVKNGEIGGGLVGGITESLLKQQLMGMKVISKEYKDIDNMLYTDFKDYYSKDKEYCVLYIDTIDKDFYEYRKLLVKNKIPSLIMALGTSDVEAANLFNEKLKIDDFDEELPAIIKIRNNKVLSFSKNITLKNLIEKCK